MGIYDDEADFCFVVNCESLVGQGIGSYGMRVAGGSVIVMDVRLVGDTHDLRINSSATVYTYGLQYETLDNAGTLEAMRGDRAAYDVANWATRHASDINSGLEVYHNPAGAGVGQAPVWDGDEWQATDIATQAELSAHEAAADPHPGYLTPAEHTAIGDTFPHHAPVTLAVDADVLLGLTAQQLTLDAQVANVVLSGPASGASADPTFRALVDADIPASIARDSEVTAAITTHEGAADPHPIYLTQAELIALNVGHIHGLARWNAAGVVTFELPDIAEYIEFVANAGSLTDPGVYTLSVNRDQIIFDTAPPAGNVIQAGYVIAQV